MSERLSWASYGGLGQLGSFLRQELADKQHVAERFNLEPSPEFIVQRREVLSSDGSQRIAGRPGELSLPDVAFITLPSAEDSRVAYEYMEELLLNGVLVVTAEKQALADYFGELRDVSDNFRQLGINAAAGGGLRAMEAASVYTHDPDNVAQVHGVLNATTVASLALLEQGLAPAEAAHEVVKAGYADPGSDKDPAKLFTVETADFRKKIPTFLNRLGILPRLIGMEDISLSLDEAAAGQLMAEPWRRPVVSAYNTELTDDRPEANGLGGGDPLTLGGWLISVSYRDTRQDTIFKNSLGRLKGPQNGFLFQLGPGGEDSPEPIILTGTGAGLGPTVNTMLDDSLMLRKS